MGREIAGTLKFYLVETSPEIKLYASPINFDPRNPYFPISSPREYSNELATEINNNGGKALAFEMDVSSIKDTEMLAKKTASQFGSIDILVNNASLYVRIKMSRVSVLELDPEEWDKDYKRRQKKS